MQIILQANDKILKMWGKSKPQSETKYRLLSFTLTADCENGVLLQNCVTGEIVFLSETEKNFLEKLPQEYNPVMDRLIKHRFLVPLEHDDKKTIKQLRNAFKIMYPPKDILTYTILPTTACNARCFYCYESNFPRVDMSPETASQVVKYIKTHSHGKEV